VKPGFPRQRRVKLVYADHLNLTGASGLLTNHQYRLNSCFDPDFTSTGHQPMGFDQWGAFYNHYVVLGCSWELSALHSGSSGTMFAAYVSDDTTIPASLLTMVELGAQTVMSNTYMGEPSVLNGDVDVADFLNRDKKAMSSDPDLRALTTGTNPSELVILNVAVQNYSSASHSTQVCLRLVYDVLLLEPRDLTPS
jgi:hypothetical protein